MSFACRFVLAGLAVVMPQLSNFGDLSAGGTATATLTVRSNGTFESAGANEGVAESGDWASPAGAGVGASFWIRYTVNSGTTPSGSATGTWLQLNSDRAWVISRGTLGSTSCDFTLEIATDAAGVNIVYTDASTTQAATVVSP